MSDNDFSLAGEASSASTTFSKYFSSFGKLRIKQILQKNDNGVWSVIDNVEYATLPDYNKDAPKGTPYRNVRLTFDLDHAKELALEAGRPADKAFDYRTRSMSVGDKDHEQFLEALESLRGKPFTSARTDKARRKGEIAEAMQKLQGQWVESEDRPQLYWDKDLKRVAKKEKEAGGGTYWTTFFPVATYKSREDVVAAIRARYNKGASNGTTATTPTAIPVVYERPDNESEKGWPRTMATIQKRLKRGDEAQAIADDLEIELQYVTQFSVGVPE